MQKLIVSLIFVLLLSGCSFADTWMGFYYPDGCLSCTEDYIFNPEFNNKDACLAWAEDLQDERNNPSDEFECGKNCKEVGSNSYMCEETVDY